MRPAPLAAFALAAALVWPAGAAGHVVPEPQFVTSGTVAKLALAVPNERPEPMTGLAVTLPDGFRIAGAQPLDGWKVDADGATATWRGGPLAHLAVETFHLDVDVTAGPGSATIDSRQLYPSGESVSWPATLTIVPGAERAAGEPSQNLGWAVGAALAGLAVMLGVAALAWRRRTRALQER